MEAAVTKPADDVARETDDDDDEEDDDGTLAVVAEAEDDDEGGDDAAALPTTVVVNVSSLGLNSLAAAAYRSASEMVPHSDPSCAAVANRTV